MRFTLWSAALVCALLAHPALAGTNAGFSATVDPATVRGPSVGEQIDIAIEIQGAVEAKHSLVVARYDSTLFTFVEFTPGELIAPPGIPEAVDGSLLEIQSGGTQLGGTLSTTNSFSATLYPARPTTISSARPMRSAMAPPRAPRRSSPPTPSWI